MLTNQDLEQIKEKGISTEDIDEQLKRFKNGFPFIQIVRAATINDGIKKLSEEEIKDKAARYERAEGLRRLKFVPASGAASRMFKHLFSFLEKYANNEADYEDLTRSDEYKPVFDFFKQIEKFAFYNDLKRIMEGQNRHLEETMLRRKYDEVLDYVLNDRGLNYGNMPKGLLKFHKYENGHSRTPVEEHLVEGANYCRSGNRAMIHFTVPPDFMEEFERHIREAAPAYEKQFGVTYDISFSVQKPSTDTIAVDMENQPFRDDDGSILFRPGGHGALLHNLNDLDYDLIFIKNIDNVAPDRLKADTYRYKKALAGVLLEYQEKIHNYLKKLENADSLNDQELNLMLKFAESELCTEPPRPLISREDKIEYLRKKLDRPIRVCGMVKNEGEPGGGPYWARNADGSVSLQIVESSQVDMNNAGQKEIFNNATHFNPVDIVFSPRDYKGGKYNLMKYRDPETGFISTKSKSGRDLKALELPGLWNGSMSDWNTIFVETPVSTFSPVKTVNDLLREKHLN